MASSGPREELGASAPRISINQQTLQATFQEINKPIKQTIMEATIQSNSISINVSVNFDAMKSSIQHLWFMVKGSWLRVAGAWSLPRLYRKVLRAMYAAERATERHPVIADSILWLMGIGLVIEVIFFA